MATSLYMPVDWVNSHKDVTQRLVNVYVKTLKWMKLIPRLLSLKRRKKGKGKRRRKMKKGFQQ